MIDPSQAPAGQPAPAPQQGTTVCIAPQGDGSFVVYPEGTEPTAPPSDIEQALEQARQMLTGAEGGQDGQKNLEAEANALFEGSFNQASGRAPV